MKRRQGATLLASSNVSRSVFSDSPDMPETTDGAEMLMNGTPSSWSIPTQTQDETSCRMKGGKEILQYGYAIEAEGEDM